MLIRIFTKNEHRLDNYEKHKLPDLTNTDFYLLFSSALSEGYTTLAGAENFSLLL